MPDVVSLFFSLSPAFNEFFLTFYPSFVLTHPYQLSMSPSIVSCLVVLVFLYFSISISLFIFLSLSIQLTSLNALTKRKIFFSSLGSLGGEKGKRIIWHAKLNLFYVLLLGDSMCLLLAWWKSVKVCQNLNSYLWFSSCLMIFLSLFPSLFYSHSLLEFFRFFQVEPVTTAQL